jgi:hypothetical protein
MATPAIPALRRLGLEGLEFKASLSYIVRPHLNTREKNKIMSHHCLSEVSSCSVIVEDLGWWTGKDKALGGC